MAVSRHIRRASTGSKKVAKKAAGVAVLVAVEIKNADWDFAYRFLKPFLNMFAQAVPPAAPVVAIVDQIVQLAQNVKTNRQAVAALADRCVDLKAAMQTAERTRKSVRLQEAIERSQTVLNEVHGRMEAWAALSTYQAVLQSTTITNDLPQSYTQVLSCIEMFQLVVTIDTHTRQEEFIQRQKQDSEDLLDQLASLREGQRLVLGMVEQTHDGIHQITSFMQNHLTDYSKSDPRRETLARNLHLLIKETGELLPDLDLSRGEVEIDPGDGITPTLWKAGRLTVYQTGTLLSSRRVLVKRIGNQMENHPKVRERFDREAQVWLKVWKNDKGRYTVPCWGYFVSEVNHYLHLVSPYYPNGTADVWVKSNPYVNHIAILRDAARGLSVLHSMRIVHGDVCGANITIGPDGNGLLSDFALSKTLDELQDSAETSAPDAQRLRWQAPETMETAAVSMRSDIWAFGMTVYELLTHKDPYFDQKWKGLMTVARMVNAGARPTRLLDTDVVKRGLDDEVWAFMTRCWLLQEADRPFVEEALELFNDPKRGT
ncbi:kinase-like protein [Heliocybe sulcata]|uniref:Kinase-like protein n=1 Tax=Heliocybe sulcata TaxID=5364 RepID=A0A5C3N2U8_9AGAM|nr:kinase-like protein [Heliocybe sulcata]